MLCDGNGVQKTYADCADCVDNNYIEAEQQLIKKARKVCMLNHVGSGGCRRGGTQYDQHWINRVACSS